MVRSVVELDYTTAVPRYTSTVLHSRRVAVVSFVVDRCYMEDTSDGVPPKSLLLLLHSDESFSCVVKTQRRW